MVTSLHSGWLVYPPPTSHQTHAAIAMLGVVRTIATGKAHRFLYHSTLGSRVIKKKKKLGSGVQASFRVARHQTCGNRTTGASTVWVAPAILPTLYVLHLPLSGSSALAAVPGSTRALALCHQHVIETSLTAGAFSRVHGMTHGPPVKEFKLLWREAGPPNHHDDKVDSDQ